MRRWVLPAVVAAGLVACLPSEPCACPPALIPYTISGVVTTAEGVPRRAINVHFATAFNCNSDQPFYDEGGAVTDSLGRYSFSMSSPAEPLCVRIRATAWPLLIEADSAVAGPVLIRPGPSRIDLAFTHRPPLAEPVYSASMEAFDGDSVRITTRMSNPAPTPIRFVLRNPCTVEFRAYAGPVEGTPAWNSESRPGGCKSFGWEVVLAGGEVRTYVNVLTAFTLLRDPFYGGVRSLPPGPYTFAAVIVQREPTARTVLLPAGTAPLE